MSIGSSKVNFLVPGGCLGDTLSLGFYPPELDPPVFVEFEFMKFSIFCLNDFPPLSELFTLANAAADAIENYSPALLLNSVLTSGDFLWFIEL